MPSPDTIYTIGDFVRRVVESLLRGDHRGQFFCSRCLVKLTKEHLDRSYAKSDVVEIVDAIFDAPGPITHTPASVCAGCGRKKVRCLGVPTPAGLASDAGVAPTG